jgi:hypothetical protein
MTTQADTKKTYVLDGTLLEACSCGGPCPCWVGDDPDGGRCDSVNAYHIDRGQVGGVDISNLSFVQVNQIPGNVLEGNWRAIFYIDDKATSEQREAILNVFSGKLGGALAGVASLVGERVAVHFVPIEHRVEGGKGTLRVGELVEAEMAPYTDANGRPTTIHDTVFSTIPGSPAYLAKASHHRVNIPEYGMIWEFSGRNAIQGDFHFEA